MRGNRSFLLFGKSGDQNRMGNTEYASCYGLISWVIFDTLQLGVFDMKDKKGEMQEKMN